MTELLVGTKKGLFALNGEPGEEFAVTARATSAQPPSPCSSSSRDRKKVWNSRSPSSSSILAGSP